MGLSAVKRFVSLVKRKQKTDGRIITYNFCMYFWYRKVKKKIRINIKLI